MFANKFGCLLMDKAKRTAVLSTITRIEKKVRQEWWKGSFNMKHPICKFTESELGVESYHAMVECQLPCLTQPTSLESGTLIP
jgi:hypothetical protein